MAKIVLKKLPPGPRPTRDQLDLRGHSELSWLAAVKAASKSKGNVLHVRLSVDYWNDATETFTTLRHPDLLGVKGALAQARDLVQTGQANKASVEGRASYSYPGARPVRWDLGGFKRVEYWEVVEALARMPGGHDYAGNSLAEGAPVADLAAKVGISTTDCYELLSEARTLQLVRGIGPEGWHSNVATRCVSQIRRADIRWYAVQYWRMELAKIERAAAQTGAGR